MEKKYLQAKNIIERRFLEMMTIKDVYEYNQAFDNFTQQIQKTTESFNNLKTLIDEAKNQIQKEKTDFVAKLLENK